MKKATKKIKLISFDKVLEKEMHNPEFRRDVEIEKKKLELSIAKLHCKKNLNDIKKARDDVKNRRVISQKKVFKKLGF